jgi:hypothetical protein
MTYRTSVHTCLQASGKKCSDVDTWAYSPRAIPGRSFGHSIATLKGLGKQFSKFGARNSPSERTFRRRTTFSRNAFRKHSSKAKTSLAVCRLSSPALGSDRRDGGMAGERARKFNNTGQADVLRPLAPTATASAISEADPSGAGIASSSGR